MKLTDTHSHLYDEAFDRDREEALARAAAEGVGQLLLPACLLYTSPSPRDS